MASRKEVFAAIETERLYQIRKWGIRSHEVSAYILFIEHHLQKARAIASTMRHERAALDELRKVTTLGVACMEEHGAPSRSADAPIVYKD
jgi:hypothetical protein